MVFHTEQRRKNDEFSRNIYVFGPNRVSFGLAYEMYSYDAEAKEDEI